MSDPARCIPPDPTVNGWWYLAKNKCVTSMYWIDSENGGWWEDFLSGGVWDSREAYEYGYHILGSLPSYEQSEKWKAAALNSVTENATWAQRCFDLADEMKAAKAEIARLREDIKLDAKSIYDAAYARGLRDAQQWLPISDAPRDGRTIILEGGTAYWIADHWYSVASRRAIEWEVKVWMPLPPPPENKT